MDQSISTASKNANHPAAGAGTHPALQQLRDDRAWANLKIWGLVGGLSAVMIFGGHILADRYGALVGFFLALALNAWVIWTVEWRLIHLFEATELEGQDAWGLVQSVSIMSGRHSLPAARVHLLECEPTSYSAGIFLKKTHLFFSRRLLERLSSEETQALVAIELARVSKQITSVGTMSCAVANLIVGFAAAIDSTIFLQGFRKDAPGQIRPMRFLLSPLVAIILRATLGHARVFKADKMAAEWIRSPQTVAHVLMKLDSYQKTRPMVIGIGDAHLFAVSPLARFAWCKGLNTQPEISARVAALTGHLHL